MIGNMHSATFYSVVLAAQPCNTFAYTILYHLIPSYPLKKSSGSRFIYYPYVVPEGLSANNDQSGTVMYCDPRLLGHAHQLLLMQATCRADVIQIASFSRVDHRVCVLGVARQYFLG